MASVTVTMVRPDGSMEEIEHPDATHSIEPAVTRAGMGDLNDNPTVVRVYAERDPQHMAKSIVLAVYPLSHVYAIEVDQ